MMRVLVVPPSGPCEVKELENSLDELQQLVGGYIEIVAPMELRDRPRIRMIVNEDFLAEDLPFNLFASYLYGYASHLNPILGTAVFAYQGWVDGEPDLVSLPDDALIYLQSMFSHSFPSHLLA